MKQDIKFTMTTPDGEFINKIQAIKGLRKMIGLDLGEAKKMVELVQEHGEFTFTVQMPNDYHIWLSHVYHCDNEKNPNQWIDTYHEGAAMMISGGIESLLLPMPKDPTVREELVKQLRGLAAEFVTTENYDIAGRLLEVLKTINDDLA